MNRKQIVLLILAVVVGVQIVYFWLEGKPEAADAGKKELLTADVIAASYIGSESCRSCHEQEFSDWNKSDHDLAMQEATSEFVLGDFEDQVFESQGVTNKFFRKDDKYWVNTEGPDGKYADYEIKYTYGVKPLQQYIVEFPGGKLQCLRTAWDSKKNKWFDLYPDLEVHPKEWLHWTKGGLNWNTMCSDCHSTNVHKNYIPEADSFATSFSIINVSCESCHGPGKAHVDFIKSNNIKKGDPYQAEQHLHQTSNLTSVEQVDQCARCHARREQITEAFDHQGSFMDHYVPAVLRDDLYHPDGQIKEEDYEYASFTQSKMYMNGVKCANCHNPHSLELKAIGNALCGQCHDQKKFDVPAHTFHAVNTEGAKCVNCHMPGTTYMGNDFRRDHSLRVPRPDQSVVYGTPNACNKCHTDQTAQWAANAIEKWFGKERKPHFSDALTFASTRNPAAAAGLVTLLNDKKQPPIVKATALWYLGQLKNDPGTLAVFVNALSDAEPIIRYTALKELNAYPLEQTQNHVLPMLKDPVRSVRIAAADALATLPASSVPASFAAPYKKATKELEINLKERADFPGGQMEAGQYYERKGDVRKAEVAYKRSLSIDSFFNPARLNLAYLQNRQGNTKEAIALFNVVLQQEPGYAEGYYSLGLLYAETNEMELAIENLKKASQLDKANTRALYNLGLAYQRANQAEAAEAVYLKGLQRFPDSYDFGNALVILYLQNNSFEKAEQHLARLLGHYPNNPQLLQMKEYIRTNR
ncbi:tetratricopeptide repeat protein [Botryobacter ruber]|uniref:tetratricopeptide repeat protein n=1 Tax=Botryobacter ruber TaxID=2171629 RepID=UPI000E0A84FB|nr:tetratricopeptide repeat protein [Botryobacter ruber]